MRSNKFNEIILDSNEIFEGLYSGQITSFDQINTDNVELINIINNHIDTNADSIKQFIEYIEPTCNIEEFDKKNQSQWFIPEEYKNLDIVNWLFDQCKTTNEVSRVTDELELYVQYEMIDILICLKYLVDFMRTHNIVWGIGRGSSVSSYCLYLIGIHKINSLKYSLDIREFLKGEENG